MVVFFFLIACLTGHLCYLVHERMAITCLALLGEKIGNQPCPASLMTCTYARPVIPMEILVEKNQVAPGGIVLKCLYSTVNGAPSVFVTEKNVGQAARQGYSDLLQI